MRKFGLDPRTKLFMIFAISLIVMVILPIRCNGGYAYW